MNKQEFERRKQTTKWRKLLMNATFCTFDIYNVPDTINKNFLKKLLMIDSGAVFFKDNAGNLRAWNITQRGLLDGYYTVDDSLVTNPIWGQRIDLSRLNSVCVYADASAELFQTSALRDLIDDTAETLALIEESIKCSIRNTKCIALIGASRDMDVATAREYINQTYKQGNPIAVVEDSFIEKLSVNPLYSTAVGQGITSLVELKQYVLGNFYNLIGLTAQENYKHANMTEDEIHMNSSPELSITHRLEMIEEGLQKVNEMFGTTMTVLNIIEEQAEEQEEEQEETDEQEASDEDDKSEGND